MRAIVATCPYRVNVRRVTSPRFTSAEVLRRLNLALHLEQPVGLVLTNPERVRWKRAALTIRSRPVRSHREPQHAVDLYVRGRQVQSPRARHLLAGGDVECLNHDVGIRLIPTLQYHTRIVR